MWQSITTMTSSGSSDSRYPLTLTSYASLDSRVSLDIPNQPSWPGSTRSPSLVTMEKQVTADGRSRATSSSTSTENSSMGHSQLNLNSSVSLRDRKSTRLN